MVYAIKFSLTGIQISPNEILIQQHLRNIILTGVLMLDIIIQSTGTLYGPAGFRVILAGVARKQFITSVEQMAG